MTKRRNKGIAGVIGGVLLIVAGSFFIAFPTAGLILHHDAESGRYFPEWMSKEGSRAYGIVGVVLGVGVVWLARWPRWGARRSAIDDYVWNLSQELSRHLGNKKYYGIEEVSRIAAESGCTMAYIAYAHAMFCSRADFDAYYGPLRVACTYDGLRDVIARRYCDGARSFDAAGVVRFATPPREEEYDFIHDA
ncbi:MAG TPA: DUF6559 family protein [Candidatus Acidoferrum sp.]|nr:DUF6559 family protein [Candidatus Acidoferrum sp.]